MDNIKLTLLLQNFQRLYLVVYVIGGMDAIKNIQSYFGVNALSQR